MSTSLQIRARTLSYLVVLIVAAPLLSPSAAASVPSELPVQISQPVKPDTALFSTVVQAVARRAESPIRVDPRPLRPDPAIGVFVRTEHFAEDAPVTAARAAVLDRLGIERFHKSTLDRCGSGPDGTPPVVEPGDTTTLRQWLSQPQPPTCVLVSLPRPGGPLFPPGGVDRRDAYGEAGVRTVRVVTMGPGQTVDVLDVVVRCDRHGGWQVVDIVRLAVAGS